MKVVAFVPIKMNSSRLPNKNILPIAGHPLCWHLCNTFLEVNGIDEVFVYCSDESIKDYIPENIIFKKRSSQLNGELVKGIEIYNSFVNEVDADIYILAHTTSPFIKKETLENALGKVRNRNYDSAFSAERVQTFAWYRGEPINYKLNDIPRTQDIEPVWIETSAFYIFKKEVFVNNSQRIGCKPYIQEVRGIEAIDIDEKKDFDLAVQLAEIEGIGR